MRSLVAILLIVPAAAAPAPDPATQPDILVTGENRVVCRRITRTATRMRVGRICRTASQWTAEPGASAADDANATIEGAADTLETLGGMHGPPPGPLGPR